MSQVLNDAKEAPDRISELLSKDQDIYSELGRRLRTLNPAFTATVARGSSDHAAGYFATLAPLCTGKPVASLPPSLVSILNAPLDLKSQFTLAISQSGSSPDILMSFERIKNSGALTAAIVNDTSSPLAKMTEFLLPQYAGLEGIAATKSVLCTLTAMARIVAEWSEDTKLKSALNELPATLTKAFQLGLQMDERVLKGVTNAYVLSRGLGHFSALEIALKFKETCGVHAEGFSAAEVRHGPREIVNKDFVVLALAVPGSGHDDVVQAAEELRAQGARVVLVDQKSLPAFPEPKLLPIVMLQMIYPWLTRSAIALGFDPDRPKTLKSKVIKTI